MNIRTTLQKIHDQSKIARYILYTVLCAVFTPFYFTGLLLFWITKPFLALSHLLMGNTSTSKNIITDWSVWKDIGDAF
tara:strand:+ start:318 stop:551 length:234 start_codon:yes stop_codon:yes gene_type:complete